MAALDRMDGDPDLEPSLAALEIPIGYALHNDPITGWRIDPGTQENWGRSATATSKEDSDLEPPLGWPEALARKGPVPNASVTFSGRWG
jgi:hypothetical protein